MRKLSGKTLALVAIIAFAPALLGGCGLKGDLQRPAPLWGDPDRDPETAPEADETRDQSDDADGNEMLDL